MFPSFLVVVHVNNSLSGRCFFLASRLTIVSLDVPFTFIVYKSLCMFITVVVCVHVIVNYKHKIHKNDTRNNSLMHTTILCNTVYCKLFMVNNLSGFCGSVGYRKTFPVK